MKIFRIAVILCFLVTNLYGQFGKQPIGLPFNTKTIQVGFNKNDVINTSFVKKSNWLYFTWEYDADYYEVEIGLPKTHLSDKFGHISITNQDFNWIRKEIVYDKSYLLETKYFDYCVRVMAYGEKSKRSQVRYVRQK